MGERIFGELDIPSKKPWQDALKTALDICTRTGMPGVPAGSFVYKILAGQPADPNDLDFFLMSPEEERTEFALRARSVWSFSFPPLDLCRLVYVGTLKFQSNGSAVLEHKGKKFPVDSTAFETYIVDYNGMEVPVLHPATYIQLLNMSPRCEKADRGLEILKSAMEQGLAKDIEMPDLAAFEDFERVVRVNLIRRFRNELDRRDKRGVNGPLVLAKKYLRDRHPQVAQTIRNILS